jgi:plasmid stabilization system protein ParE
METSSAKLQYTDRARRDMRRMRHFLRRHCEDQLMTRVREILNAVRYAQQYPKLRPVEGLSLKGFELRHRRAGKFVVVYSYFEPSTSCPDGVVSVRAIRHAAEEDVMFGVEERSAWRQGGRLSFLMLK